MDTGMATATAATATATAVSSAAMSDHMDASSGSCKISMLWNWYTVDSCFISTSWRITSRGMFAGSCIGVILLVIVLEFLRRLGKEYDGYIIRQHQRSQTVAAITNVSDTPRKDSSGPSNFGSLSLAVAAQFRPSLPQQATRATLHMLQFAVAYFVMLLAMYYNGFFIICIFIGAWIGSFFFSWETINVGGPKEEATVCCG